MKVKKKCACLNNHTAVSPGLFLKFQLLWKILDNSYNPMTHSQHLVPTLSNNQQSN